MRVGTQAVVTNFAVRSHQNKQTVETFYKPCLFWFSVLTHAAGSGEDPILAQKKRRLLKQLTQRIAVSALHHPHLPLQ